MTNVDSITNENDTKMVIYSNYPYRILIIGGSKSGKINALINLINEQMTSTKFICMQKI